VICKWLKEFRAWIIIGRNVISRTLTVTERKWIIHSTRENIWVVVHPVAPF
jgi:hypothetical protein